MSNDESPEKTLAFIKSMIKEGEKTIRDTGSYWILWGSVVVFCTLASYILGFARLETWIAPLWILVYGGAMVAAFLIGRHEHATAKASGFGAKVTGATWLAIGCSLVVFSASALIAHDGFSTIMRVLAVLLGTAYFITGRLLKVTWIFLGAFGWWAGAIAIGFIGDRWAPAVVATLVFALELVPGIVLKLRSGKP